MLFFDNDGGGWLVRIGLPPERVLDPSITGARFASAGLVREERGQRICTVDPADALVRSRADVALGEEARKLLLHLATYVVHGPVRAPTPPPTRVRRRRTRTSPG